MEEKNVPYIVYESALARNERVIKRIIILLCICIALLFLSNAAWLYAWCQYDYESAATTMTYTQDGEGFNVMGNENEVTYGPNTEQNHKGAKAYP